MHPILLELGPITIHTYGFFIALGVLISFSVIRRLAIQEKLNPEKVLDITFLALIFGFLGARLLFVLTRIDYFLSNPAEIFAVWNGGLVFYGGPIFAIPLILWLNKKRKLPLWKTVDVLTPGLVISHAFGRMGCLAAGCCYGKPTGKEWGIKLYSDLVDSKFHGVFLHPVQLYESGSLFILFIGLLILHKKKSFDGQVFLTYMIIYPILRSILEIYRGDLIRGFVIEGILSTSQFISILMFLVALGFMIYRLKTMDSKK
jgi:phosphatidylglycerol:prolipoprotein diacylglycerol transferase